jgi:hypothetical protein
MMDIIESYGPEFVDALKEDRMSFIVLIYCVPDFFLSGSRSSLVIYKK